MKKQSKGQERFALMWGENLWELPWITLPHMAFDLFRKEKVSMSMAAVLLGLLSFVRNEEKSKPPSSYIAYMTGLTTSTVNEHIESLKKKGLLNWVYIEPQARRGRREYDFTLLHAKLALLASEQRKMMLEDVKQDPYDADNLILKKSTISKEEWKKFGQIEVKVLK